MFKIIKIFGIIVVAANLNSCANTWNLLNKNLLKGDMNKVIKTDNLGNMDCNMVGLNRTGICTFSTSPQVINQLVSSLYLKKYSSDTELNKVKHYTEIPRLVTLEKGCELIYPFSEGSSTVLYQSSENNRNLFFDSGSFNYLQLYHHQKNNQSCIQVTYSYG